METLEDTVVDVETVENAVDDVETVEDAVDELALGIVHAEIRLEEAAADTAVEAIHRRHELADAD